MINILTKEQAYRFCLSLKQMLFLKEYLEGKEYQEILLPFFDKFGDQLSVYIERKDDRFLITDDKYIYNNYFDTGNNELIETICREHGVTFKDGELYIVSNESDIYSRVPELAIAMIEIDNLKYENRDSFSVCHNFFASSPEKFIEAVELAEHDRTPKYELPGRQLKDSDEILALMAKRKR